MKREHAEAFMSEGRIRIGSIFQYRSDESLLTAQRDHEEGMIERVESHLNVHAGTELGDVFRRHTGFRGEAIDLCARGIHMRGNRFIDRIITPPLFLYCMSRTLSPELFDSFSSDCVVKIDLRNGNFLAEITQQLRAAGAIAKIPLFGDVVYTNKSADYKTLPPDVMPELVKDVRFASQAETRACWLASDEFAGQTYLDIACADLSIGCTLLLRDEAERFYQKSKQPDSARL